MNLKIISNTPAPLLMRAVITADLDYDKVTPSNEEVRKKVAAVVSADPNLVVVKKIANSYGLRKAKVTAYVYEDALSLKRIEPKEKKDAKAKPGEKKEEASAEKKE